MRATTPGNMDAVAPGTPPPLPDAAVPALPGPSTQSLSVGLAKSMAPPPLPEAAPPAMATKRVPPKLAKRQSSALLMQRGKVSQAPMSSSKISYLGGK